MTGPAVRLVIDRLVLHGVDRADSAAVRRALAAELETRLAGVAIDANAGRDGLRLDLPVAANPALLGRSAGAGIVGALTAQRSPLAALTASPASAGVQRQAIDRSGPPDAGPDPWDWQLDDLLREAEPDMEMVRPPSGDLPAVFRSRRPPSPLLPAAPPATPPAAAVPPEAAAPSTATRSAGNPSAASEAMIRFIQHHEGFHRRLPNGMVEAYPETIGGTVIWTIGWGSTGRDIGPGTVWTMAQCRRRFARQLAFFERGVAARLRGIPTTQSEFDAFVSLAYNAGLGGLDQSEALRLHRAGDRAGAAEALRTALTRAGRDLVVSRGLIRRRQDEANFYLGTPPPPPLPRRPHPAPDGSRRRPRRAR